MAFQGDSIFWVEVEKIVPNPFQPRREFDEQKLRELSESVRMYGILQPLTVTRKEIQREDGTFYTEYELIAGERRLRASKLAGLTQVPVIIRDGEDTEQEKLELAIIENLQREDLNAVDRALAFRQLADVFGLSHTEVAKKVGRSREYVSNSIRLLALPDYMLSSLKLGEMTEGHARTLLMLNDRPEEQDVVFREILMKKLSVREVERIVRKIATDKVRKKNPGEFDAELIEIEKKFMETLGTRVQIQKTDYGGRLTIDYFSVEDLETMLNKMKNEQAAVAGGALGAAALLSEHTPLSVTATDEVVPLDDTGLETALQSDEVILGQAEAEPVEIASFAEPVTENEPVRDGTPTFASVFKEEVEPYIETPVIDNQVIETSQEPVVYNPIMETKEETPEVTYHHPVWPSPVESVSTSPATPSVEEAVHMPTTLDVSNHLASEATPETPDSATQAFADMTPVTPSHNPFIPQQSPIVEDKKDEDESDLYSLRNFGI
jgi:ParB family chromosome partitioning protein